MRPKQLSTMSPLPPDRSRKQDDTVPGADPVAHVANMLLSAMPYPANDCSELDGNLQLRTGRHLWDSDVPVELEATDSVRALLREWTHASPAIIAAWLPEEKDNHDPPG